MAQESTTKVWQTAVESNESLSTRALAVGFSMSYGDQEVLGADGKATLITNQNVGRLQNVLYEPLERQSQIPAVTVKPIRGGTNASFAGYGDILEVLAIHFRRAIVVGEEPELEQQVKNLARAIALLQEGKPLHSPLSLRANGSHIPSWGFIKDFYNGDAPEGITCQEVIQQAPTTLTRLAEAFQQQSAHFEAITLPEPDKKDEAAVGKYQADSRTCRRNMDASKLFSNVIEGMKREVAPLVEASQAQAAMRTNT